MCEQFIDIEYEDKTEPKIIKQMERYVIKDTETNKFFHEKDIWREDSFYLTRNICSAKQFYEKEDAEKVISEYEHRNLEVIKIKISYEELED